MDRSDFELILAIRDQGSLAGAARCLNVAPLLVSGQLVRVLPAYSMPEADIHWLAPYRPDTPRPFVD